MPKNDKEVAKKSNDSMFRFSWKRRSPARYRFEKGDHVDVDNNNDDDATFFPKCQI